MKLRTLAVSGASVLALSLTLSACGGADEDSGSGSSSSGSSSKKSDDGGDTYADVTPNDGATVDGDGYEFKVPKGWNDVSAQVKQQQPQIDVAYNGGAPVDGFRSNVNVSVLDPAYTGRLTRSVVDDGTKQIVSQLESSGAKQVQAQDQVVVADEPTIHITAQFTAVGKTYNTDQYLILHDGSGYTVTFSTPTSYSQDQRDEISQPALASWEWS